MRLREQPVILVGTGEAAEAKRRLLERAGAHVVGEDDTQARLAIVAGDDAAVARLRARGLLVNAVDRSELCDFTLPAIVDRAPVLVAIGTGGVSAGLAAALRQRLEQALSPKLGRVAELLYTARARLRATYPDGSDRRHAIAAALDTGAPLDLADPDLAADWIGAPLVAAALHRVVLTSRDPDDLTLRQARLFAAADRVYHRSGVPAAILDRARADAPRIACAAPPDDPGPGLSLDVS